MTANASARQPQNGADENTQHRAMSKELRQVKLWKLV